MPFSIKEFSLFYRLSSLFLYLFLAFFQAIRLEIQIGKISNNREFLETLENFL